MSLYKTQRCRHFDEAGNPTKPYCSQGNKCRFIHPNDYQWTKLRRRVDESPSPEHRDSARSKGKHALQLSPSSPLQRQRSSPLIPQTDLFKRKQRDDPREHDPRDAVWNRDRRRDSDSWGYSRDRDGPSERGHSLKRANDGDNLYPNQRPKLSESALHAPAPRDNTRHAAQADKIICPVPHVSTREPKATRVPDTFHRLAKLCCEIVRDTCFLDREEDKMKAFTGLSSELSRAVPDAAMAVTPALATVITGHTRTRERLEKHMEDLEMLWKTLFSMLEGDIARVIDSRLEQAMAILANERDSALRVITRSQRLGGDMSHDGKMGPCQPTGGRRETATDRTTALLERSTMSVDGGPTSPEKTRPHQGSTSLLVVPTQGEDLGMSLRNVLEDMKMQMNRQTRAIELLAKENQQLKSAGECLPQRLGSPDSVSSSPRKPSIL